MAPVLWMTSSLSAALSILLWGSAHAQQMSDPPKPRTSRPATSAPPVKYGERPNGNPFNPERCKTGKKGYVYWAARDQVFKFRYDPTKPVYPRTGNPNVVGMEDIPPAPVPSEPEGCYGNPLRGGGVPYMRHHGAELFHDLTGREINTAAGGGGLHAHFAIRERRLLLADDNELNKKMFLSGNNCRPRKSGIVECEISKGTKEDDYHTQALKIESKLIFKDANEARDIYVIVYADTVSHLSLEKHGKAIRSSFDLYKSVRLHDSFRIFPNEIDLLIPYYRGMIRYVMDAHVLGYQWQLPKTK